MTMFLIRPCVPSLNRETCPHDITTSTNNDVLTMLFKYKAPNNVSLCSRYSELVKKTVMTQFNLLELVSKLIKIS